MAVPIILGVVAAGSALYGVYKGVNGAIDQNDASGINNDAKTMVDQARSLVATQREATNGVLEDYGSRKLRAFNGVIADFIDTFGRLKNVDIIETAELDKLQQGDFSTLSLEDLQKDYQLLKDAGLGVGAGLGGGAAVAFGAYNGTMLLGTASTGTAISTLSGAAATNATLAWLGGGAISAGGGGVALGTAVLGGLVAGPALAIFGHIVGNKAEAALNDARSNLEKAKTIRDDAALTTKKLKAIQEVTTLANGTFSKVSSQLRRSVSDLRSTIDTHGEDYQAYSSDARETVFRSVKFAQLIKAMIDTPILQQDGQLVETTKARVQDIGQAASGQ
ncbi:hypothetical protein EUC41_12855 [Achromobacter denitrificans]|uniref:Chemotaxis protein n=1 Tax=Achromobacter denitrificans TaxID=32002 RepID=A0A6N0JPX0_ACHDE|nr:MULTISPECIES: hypothetical protein [Achromobacter]MBV2160858.1 hypothetical protein [Achromobacter denitrificans]MDF3860182.1 hypothetical protein [Achromobacter denitrificans]MDF3939105.1 hypothetical protein [Achromobacter denitrificans]MDX3877937.1 hypothetical protein [Achromobacter sp.]QKQ49193.1 hypothetical protein FOC81_21800 [Achromobacter denitrificans]